MLTTLTFLNAQPTNYSMDFNGAGASVNLGNAAGNSIRSIEFWFKPGATINASTSASGYSLIIRDDLTQTHEFGVVDPTAGMLLYINGVLQTSTDGSATAASDIDKASSTILGRWPTVTRYFDGLMDELRLWSRAIS
jgi:hypothetical protein